MSLNFILIIIFFEIGIFLLFLFLSTLFKKISQKFDTLVFKLILFVTLNVWIGCGCFLYNTSKNLLDPTFWDPDTGEFLFFAFYISANLNKFIFSCNYCYITHRLSDNN